MYICASSAAGVCQIALTTIVFHPAGVCQGVDYDDRNGGCYIHTAATVCNELISKDFCTHYTRVICSNYALRASSAVSTHYTRVICCN